jgi:hypothetical protein
MTYRIFPTGGPYAPKTYSQYLARKSMLMAKVAVDLLDALAFARNFIATGQEIWEIEGDDGSLIERNEVHLLIRTHAAELTNRPRVY